jgi:CTP synthase
MVEIKNHPYFEACQFHPEFKSRPTAPHPLFSGLVKAALDQKKKGSAPAKNAQVKTAPAKKK